MGQMTIDDLMRLSATAVLMFFLLEFLWPNRL